MSSLDISEPELPPDSPGSYVSTKHTALRSQSKDRLARNQNNVSEWSNMSTCGLLFQ